MYVDIIIFVHMYVYIVYIYIYVYIIHIYIYIFVYKFTMRLRSVLLLLFTHTNTLCIHKYKCIRMYYFTQTTFTSEKHCRYRITSFVNVNDSWRFVLGKCP